MTAVWLAHGLGSWSSDDVTSTQERADRGFVWHPCCYSPCCPFIAPDSIVPGEMPGPAQFQRRVDAQKDVCGLCTLDAAVLAGMRGTWSLVRPGQCLLLVLQSLEPQRAPSQTPSRALESSPAAALLCAGCQLPGPQPYSPACPDGTHILSREKLLGNLVMP